MFDVLFYEDKNGYSEIYTEIQHLSLLSENNKNARIQFSQIELCVNLLKLRGAKLPSNYSKHIEGDLWELRPGKNRILYFYFMDDKYVLLHMFKKKTQKTPKKEIEKAIFEINDYRSRFGGK